jgi:hypothetical protein
MLAVARRDCAPRARALRLAGAYPTLILTPPDVHISAGRNPLGLHGREAGALSDDLARIFIKSAGLWDGLFGLLDLWVSF